MGDKQQSGNLQRLFEDIENASQKGESVSVNTIMEEIGSRSFGPLLLLAGVVVLAPIIGDIPGVPTIIGIIVFLVALQLLLGRHYIWLPRWLLDRNMPSGKLRESMKRLRRPARFVDRFIHPRHPMFVSGRAIHGIAITCLLVSLLMPAMEVVPFSANAAGLVLTAFGLALIARDGSLALAAFVVTISTVLVAAYFLL